MLERVRAQGDEDGARILSRILDDEIRHVRFGTRHFGELCRAGDEDPVKKWQFLVETYFGGSLKPPFNDSAREAAGLSRSYRAGIV